MMFLACLLGLAAPAHAGGFPMQAKKKNARPAAGKVTTAGKRRTAADGVRPGVLSRALATGRRVDKKRQAFRVLRREKKVQRRAKIFAKRQAKRDARAKRKAEGKMTLGDKVGENAPLVASITAGTLNIAAG